MGGRKTSCSSRSPKSLFHAQSGQPVLTDTSAEDMTKQMIPEGRLSKQAPLLVKQINPLGVYTRSQTSVLLGVSPPTVDRLIAEGRLSAADLGNGRRHCWRITGLAILRLLGLDDTTGENRGGLPLSAPAPAPSLLAFPPHVNNSS